MNDLNRLNVRLQHLSEGGVGIFGFGYFVRMVFQFFGFDVDRGLRIFSFLNWLFSVFVKNTGGFLDLYPMWFLVFYYLSDLIA